VWKNCPAWKEIGYRVDVLESTEVNNKQREDFRLAEDKKHLLIHFLFLARARKSKEIDRLLDPLDPDETLWCNSFNETNVEWTETGSLPYLDDTDGSYIESATKKAQQDEFGFVNTTHSTDTLNSVYLYLEGSGNGSDTQDVYLHNGTSWSSSFGFVFGSMGYQNTDVSAFLDTWAKVDACLMRIIHENAANSCTIRRAYLFCNYTSEAQQYDRWATASVSAVGTPGRLALLTRENSGATTIVGVADRVYLANRISTGAVGIVGVAKRVKIATREAIAAISEVGQTLTTALHTRLATESTCSYQSVLCCGSVDCGYTKSERSGSVSSCSNWCSRTDADY